MPAKTTKTKAAAQPPRLSGLKLSRPAKLRPSHVLLLVLVLVSVGIGVKLFSSAGANYHRLAACPLNHPTLRVGSTNGACVRYLQSALGINADGSFGSGTKTAVLNWQKKQGLTQDGVVGNMTWQSLDRNVPPGKRLLRPVDWKPSWTDAGQLVACSGGSKYIGSRLYYSKVKLTQYRVPANSITQVVDKVLNPIYTTTASGNVTITLTDIAPDAVLGFKSVKSGDFNATQWYEINLRSLPGC